MQTSQIRVPESMRVEHAEIHDGLVRATKAPGRVGAAARELAAILHPHFVREEEIALPPLGLLTDALRGELPRMLEEHTAIRAATSRLGEVARAEGNAEVVHLTENLARHAQSEEELFYPAAVLIGDLVRARSIVEVTP
jgi:hypothetical protein